MDPLLSRALSGLQAADAGCVDAETMAAWVERTLPSSAAAQVEAHVSSCSRCQAAMATLVRSIPAPTPVESLWKRWQLGWLVPIAGTAAAVAIYVAARPPAQPAPELAQSRAAVASATPAAVPPSVTPESDAKREARADTAPSEKTAPPPAAQGNVARDAASPREEQVQQRGRAPQSETAGLSAEASRPQASAPAAPPASAPREAQAPGVGSVAETVIVSGVAPVVEARRAFTVEPLEVRSATGAERWRVAAGATVQHSIDSGATWQAGTAPVSGGIRAGSAPGAGICWLVGNGGAVWVATDGTTFRRLPFPETIDLASVLATSARAATVTSSDGRTFRTDDQGMTWSQ